jgi:hypothetical protein
VPFDSLIGRGSSTTSVQTSVTATLTAIANSGDLVVVIVTANGGAYVQGTITDTQGNVWVIDAQQNRSDLVSCSICRSILGTSMGIGDTITFPLNIPVGRTAYSVARYTGLSTSISVIVSHGTNSASNIPGTTSLSVGTGDPRVYGGDTISAFSYSATAATDAFTHDASCTQRDAIAIGGSGSAFRFLAWQDRVTPIGAQTASGALATAGGYAACMVCYKNEGAEAAPADTIPTTGHAHLGITTTGSDTWQQLQDDEAQIGRDVAIHGHFQAFPAKDAVLSTGYYSSSVIPSGIIPMIHINANNLSVDNTIPGPGIPLDSTWDNTVTGIFTKILSLGVDVFLRYHFEFQQLTGPIVGGHNISGLANSLATQRSNFIAFWQAGWNSYTAALATYRLANPASTNRVYWVWAPTGPGYDDPAANGYAPPWYPGDHYVDVIAGDFYQRNLTAATFDSPTTLHANGYAWATTNTRGASPDTTTGVTDGTKSFMLSESGCVEASDDPLAKAVWMAEMTSWFLSHSKAIAWIYNDAVGSVQDNRIDSTSQSLAAYRTAAITPPFLGASTPTISLLTYPPSAILRVVRA